VYDFGPVFRAEKSKTRHHLSEFWMMDAEMAFYDQDMNMDLQERLIKRVVSDVLEHCQVELKTLERDTTLLERLIKEPFPRLSHAEVKQLLAADGLAVDPLDDLTTEEELHLGKKYELPVFVVDYPLAVKAFYMKRYTDEQGVVRARCADLIAPEEGREIIGGSQREDDYETLLKEITDRNYSLEDYAWYLNTRKFGSVPHSGFGPGLERLVRWISGVHHIRETIPFPRNLTRNRP
jgi:asparaginyl-tRNA synthetase